MHNVIAEDLRCVCVCVAFPVIAGIVTERTAGESEGPLSGSDCRVFRHSPRQRNQVYTCTFIVEC